ncbi:olfactory receptor 52B2-like [Solea solea]|uniref:olfactory receptor 52B2-like n=1 Tax=Solea solea TaxID=90069 RepID=UPI00272BA196|nr:olfactory receptor 52B2-like [Solea solea]
MSTNSSPLVYTLETLALPDASIYPMFFLGTLTYVLLTFFNVLLLTTIALNKKLHKPMFILLFNLPLSDMVCATAFFPHFIYSIMTQDRLINKPACIIQAFLIHFYGTGNMLILTAMAYDRYVAVCCPLRYNTIMSPPNLVRIITTVWLITFLVIGVLFFLLMRLKVCRRNVVDLFCNNPSLLKMVCEDTTVNNIYGLMMMCVVQGGSLAVVMYSYVKILHVCFVTSQTDTRRKAIQTCGTHLIVFLIFQINSVTTLISHRIVNANPYVRRLLGVSILVFPPFLDPIIYGLKSAELKQSLRMFLKRNVVGVKL